MACSGPGRSISITFLRLRSSHNNNALSLITSIFARSICAQSSQGTIGIMIRFSES